ncbi:MAG: beta-lactamase family protein [Saprospiraceae bacterium]|nr:beta-lactamase family protein [Saprospiraceae bacterium]
MRKKSDKKIKKTISIILICTLVIICGCGNNDMNKIDEILKTQVDKGKTPSVQYILFDENKVIHHFQYGYSDVANKEKVNDNTTYNAFSVTKTFTAIAILQLQEIGQLDIDNSVKQYLSNFQYSEEITIRQLLSHSSGIPNPIPLSWIHLLEEHQEFSGNKFFEGIFKKNTKTKLLPNKQYSYSNLGYVILGQLIEQASGVAYEKYINDNILQTIGVPKNELSFTIDPTRQAKGYQKKRSFSNWILGFLINKDKYMDKAEGKWKPFKFIYVNGEAYGGLIGTPNAFMKYIQDLMKSDGKLLSQNSKNQLFAEKHTADKKPSGMCLSWFKGNLNNHNYFTHAGGGGGYYTEIRIYPEIKIGSVIMFNRTGMKDERFLDKLDQFVIE